MKSLRFWGGLVLSAALIGGLFGAARRSVAALPVSAPVRPPAGWVLILDPGHGGEDGGALSVTGTKESAVNLAIAQKCAALAAFLGTNPVMTRDAEELSYPETAQTTRARKVADQKGRVALVNSYPEALLVSIHQNKYTSSLPTGAQVFYTPAAQGLAEALQEQFLTYVNRDRKRTAKPVSDTLYLMKHITCPALLVECGFLSNPEEAARLEDPSHQTKLAVLIIGTVLGGEREK